jgi:hypothetical protein
MVALACWPVHGSNGCIVLAPLPNVLGSLRSRSAAVRTEVTGLFRGLDQGSLMGGPDVVQEAAVARSAEFPPAIKPQCSYEM